MFHGTKVAKNIHSKNVLQRFLYYSKRIYCYFTNILRPLTI